MLTRRGFLQTTGSASLAAVATFRSDGLARLEAASRHAAGVAPDDLAGDEDYWREIQQAFTLDRTIINLNNGGVSPSPRIVTEAFVRYTWQQEDATAYTMWQILEPQSETIRTGLAEVFGCSPEEIAITRNASRQSPITPATAGSPALWSFHGSVSSMKELAAPMRSHTAAQAPAKSRRSSRKIPVDRNSPKAMPMP